MTVKEHYDYHLGNFYSWMMGDFDSRQAEQAGFFQSHGIKPKSTKIAVDLGAGNGIQSVPLARLGFSVIAVDFNKQLLTELRAHSSGMEITIVEGSIIGFSTYLQQQPELIICMGDTLTHLASKEEVGQLIGTASKKLADKGKLVFSFRDLTVNLVDEQRFIPVKSDENRILTCFLEYFPDYVNVFDLLYEKQDGKWTQKVSCYPKIRISAAFIESLLTANGFHLLSSEVINRMVYVVAQKT